MTTTSLTPADTVLAWSAGQIVERIAAGEISAAEVTEAFLARIEKINPRINAIIFPLFDQARAAAAAVDAARARGEVLGPLAGLPMTVKEAYDMVGTPTTVGLVSRASHRATSDAFHVARLRTAGAVFVGKTNVPQLMLSNDSQNPLYGPTKNPWNLNRSAGGSSGGEASAIAAGFAPLGLGSDIGGKLALPANACGICSLKPTSGRLTMAGHFDPLPGQEAILAQPGPMARHVSDLDMAFRFLATPEQCTVDPAVPPLPASDPAAVRGPLRVAFYTDNGVFAVAPAVARAVRRSGRRLARTWPHRRGVATPRIDRGLGTLAEPADGGRLAQNPRTVPWKPGRPVARPPAARRPHFTPHDEPRDRSAHGPLGPASCRPGGPLPGPPLGRRIPKARPPPHEVPVEVFGGDVRAGNSMPSSARSTRFPPCGRGAAAISRTR